MNKREKKLMIATVAAVGIFGAWTLGLGDMFDEAGDSTSALRELETEFHDNLRALEDMYVVERDFRLVAVTPGDERTSDFTPAIAFQQEVYDIASAAGFSIPNTLRTEQEDIDGVDEYVLLSVAIRTNGSYNDTIDLLKKFEQAGMIFRELEITSSRDRDPVDTRVTVARISDRPIRRGMLGTRGRPGTSR